MKKIVVLMLVLMSLTVYGDLKTPIEVSINEIKKEFKLNPARAKKFYSQQPIVVQMTVKAIKENAFAPIIYIYDTNSDFALDIKEEECTDEILALNPGDSFKVVAMPYDLNMGTVYAKFITTTE